MTKHVDKAETCLSASESAAAFITRNASSWKHRRVHCCTILTSTYTHIHSRFHTSVCYESHWHYIQAHTGGLLGRGQWLISKTYRIISVCSGGWQESAFKLLKQLALIGLHLSSQTELRTVWERKERESDYWQDSDENWSQDNESRCLFILSSCASLALIIQNDWSESSFTVGCLLKNPEHLQMSSSVPPSFHHTTDAASSPPLIFSPPPSQFELLHPSSLWLFIPRSSICLFFFIL